ncbi:glutathione S-transferase family protein [Psychrobium sp. 1_MG-2023]|uniref:glutathione S-transferase family protein n=1 Tax=Psychrobium sp. 1_MG-2023 TaxID=3062624 RepID=UPI000C33540A|nr:glutathione S-transferase family protein [Psychrobium sp. 1_MG-2023]MDP2561899.1 glutathione S-transferase family protein [Psychrobium sp. 1_MG-2023]PKF59685.1 glutathione S-transferase [Alteromonadales bacterium alter-6D02]
MAIIYGVPASPYVRKVMLAHAFKQVNYELKVTMPGSEDEEFRQASPFGKVPGYRTDDGFSFCDSSVIIAYLEKTTTDHKLYPDNANQLAKALWIEEYADTKMMEATAALYYQRVIGPKFFEHQTDPERVKELIEKVIPQALNYIESQLTTSWVIDELFSIADLAVAANLINLFHADFDIDVNQWPKLSAYADRILELEIVQQQMGIETKMFS